MSYRINRRAFLGGAASVITWATLPFYARAATTTNLIRVEWQTFKTTPHYAPFLNAVRTMQANTNAADPNSWQYWTNVHANYCPHKQPYFLAWHRGYLYYLERQIRLVSGDAGFTLPYWDWFTNPHVPAEFTDQASGNPLYCPRLNTNVYNALDLSPWASTTVNFQRGTVNSFEEKFETAPHNPVHNIIGNSMATMQSPRDPIFYLHHANVDRLWHAWALPDGRTMPVPSDPYWSGLFTYATGLTILKEQTYSARTRLGYDYDNASRPTTMPPQAQVGRIIRVQASIGPSHTRPPAGSFTATAARNIDTGVRSIGGVKAVTLREQSTTARITGEAASTAPVQQLLSATAAPYAAAERGDRSSAASVNGAAAGQYRSIRVVFDEISLTQAGAAGGYYYNVYLNLPDRFDTDTARQQNLLGTFGAFEIAGASHHGMVMLEYPATASLLKTGNGASRDYYVTLERVNGPNAPRGAVINVGEIRVELSTEPAYIVSPARSRAPTDVPY
ncbi:tyrosinase family protein [Paraburkholderia phymatum]|uniref:Tyrosinase n=1 Tax=Paraburkholderia phymatum (strain DSM 17167 / CIP 108236 / LMG 21445 / STM815) TaxID=391038 RepID=B2JRT6_PARP8|nr:tyrosinase family protein [Paraburkholderia phymatum]ACC73855.1 tyrosinase [Paraburkholderia phymatum STM815]